MQKIIFFNHKGGVGKTTITGVSAQILSQDKKVLLIDLDEQNTLAQFFDFDKTVKKSICDKSKSPISIRLFGYVSEEKIIFQVQKNLDLIINDSATILEDIIKKEGKFNLNHAVDLEKYDYVFFDLPPLLNITTLSVLQQVDQIFLVLDCEKASSSKAKTLVTYLQDQDINTSKIKGTVPNKYLYIHKNEHDKVIDDFTLDLDKTVLTLKPIKNRIAIKNKSRLDEYKKEFAEIIKLINKKNSLWLK